MFKKVLFWGLLLTIQLGQAQSKYTRQDSLRGKLSPLRSCYDVVFYDLNLRVEPDKKFISGYNTIVYKAISNFNRLQIDLFENLKIEKILHQNQALKFEREGNATFVDFKSLQIKGKIDSIAIYYSGNPRVAVNAPWDGGFSWAKDKNNQPWVGVSCEGLGASVWWPNKDHLSDEPDSMRIVCEVPNGLTCVANGNLRQKLALPDGFNRFEWRVSYPINNYNVTLNIAHYEHFSDVYTAQDGEKLALDYYVLPYHLDKAKKQFEQVKPMLACYEKLFGKYPFWRDGFALVETPYLGMEHQSAVAYGNGYRPGYMGYDITGTGIGTKFDYIIIHETGHEYWGNNVSCKDHAELWIHESFCTYSEALYVECMYGKAMADDYLRGYQGGIANNQALVADLEVNADPSSDIYPKGAVMLHTLRNVINDDKIWFEILKGLNVDFRHQTVDTQQIIAYINQKTGQDLSYFFRQYLYHPLPPRLQYRKVGKNWTVRWQAETPNFKMPIEIAVGKDKFKRFEVSPEWKTLPINVSEFKINDKAFYVELEQQ
ncbi:MAG: M1 family metallopeptidase [Microscillaceae bacterium]|jgi:aminopeptidase N|nr:M1 family metallopeptidase [Microscillaceae bacterium]